ncbi:hypothetical protein [Methylocapsa sp. S129]|uniref:hypothetical protein n=1 Tax=Methylocapsa sp. S129 TaxID=1641869 RepID=UPI00131B8AE1|nr:hypothetical protein [Methylocapsa sp. S129]
MTHSKCILIAAAIVLLGSGAAKADCTLSPFAFFPDRNDRVEVTEVTDDKSFCDNSFREGPGYRFTDVSVVEAPPHGLIATLGPHHFAYHSMPNYRGSDQYSIRACATVGERKGCSTLIYNVTVR